MRRVGPLADHDHTVVVEDDHAGDIAAAGRHLLSVIHAMTQQEESESGRVDLARSALEAVQLVQARGVEPGDHVITSDLEHNSISRPLRALSEGTRNTALPRTPD